MQKHSINAAALMETLKLSRLTMLSVCILLVLFCAPLLWSQSKTRESASLESGPSVSYRLPYAALNGFLCLHGLYSLPSEKNVTVWYTRHSVAIDLAWIRFASLDQVGQRLRAYTYYMPVDYPKTESTSLLVDLPTFLLVGPDYSLLVTSNEDPATLSRFVQAFCGKFATLFLRSATDAELSFPAFVEF